MADSMLDLLKSVCKYHRSKEYYVSNQKGEMYLPEQSGNNWCLLTQGPVGPDDKFVSAAECTPTRSCFKSQIPE
ncbi:MAG TPA: hypothetical protein VM123_10035 [archaeon]|nr:hypothetical protein [archaeon]